jgi:hypothetical protein
MTLLITVNKKYARNVAVIDVISVVIISKVFISIAVVSYLILWLSKLVCLSPLLML